MIDASQRMLKVNSQGELGGLSPPQKRHLELEIKTLKNAPRDAEKLDRLLKAKQRQKEEAMHIEDTQRLVTEIEMLKVVSYLVSTEERRNSNKKDDNSSLKYKRRRRRRRRHNLL